MEFRMAEGSVFRLAWSGCPRCPPAPVSMRRDGPTAARRRSADSWWSLWWNRRAAAPTKDRRQERAHVRIQQRLQRGQRTYHLVVPRVDGRDVPNVHPELKGVL